MLIMISATELTKGVVLNIDKELYMVIVVQHIVAAGRIGAMTRIKLRNIKTGATTERSFKQDEKFEDVEIARRKVQYLYQDGENCTFMDNENYEQFNLSKRQLGKAGNFLVEGMEVIAIYQDESLITVELPPTINIKVKSTLPPMKSEQSGSSGKSAVLENGVEILVPLFIKDNDVIKVDTSSGEYIERLVEKVDKEERQEKKR